MPFYSTPLYSPPKRDLPTLLAAALPFLRGELHLVDPALPGFVDRLSAAGAGECWHKDGCFLGHLTDVYRILKLWLAPDPVARCGLFHSVYSNSYVDLAIFDPAADGRDILRRVAGSEAERLIHLFCIVPRHNLIHDDLIFHYSDAELVDHLDCSQASLRRAREDNTFDSSEPWREKLRSVLPANGIRVKHIRTGEDVPLSRRMVATFLLMTMADFSDQLYAFQDELFDNDDGRMEFTGNTFAALWPGDARPGLWMNSLSRMGALYNLIVREEELFLEERKRVTGAIESKSGERDEEIELVVPPVFDNCTKILDTKEQREARDLYWEAMSRGGEKKVGGLERVERLLLESCEKNPFVGEPHLVLAQVYASQGRFEKAEKEAAEGQRLLLEWGSSWDKRMSWDGWVAWGRLLLSMAKEKTWPQTSFGILNLGLVK
ncbi:Tetratricopeptide-like helical [Cocos nucifera]|uniref:Tetratricopeptide-like helical n=1 Tax=Cocos nucifera TaxID=13894 RepID=A0A8K0INJ0_COCNU|nr:Tetratricopeptide-like helical [Cocos nucifera]